MPADMHIRKFDPYVPRILLRRLVAAPAEPVLREEGTVVFIDLSGFTRLSERLSRKGKEGAEQVVETINSCFTVLLSDAYQMGGSLLKWAGEDVPGYFDPVYNCRMQMLRFDSRFPNPRYETAVEEIRETMSGILVISPERPAARTAEFKTVPMFEPLLAERSMVHAA